MPACGSTRLIAACHVLHRLPVPRHPPYALIILMVLDFALCSFQRPDAFALAGARGKGEWRNATLRLQGSHKALKTEQQLLDREIGQNPPPKTSRSILERSTEDGELKLKPTFSVADRSSIAALPAP
jgi:hypothetical protein